MNNKIIKTKEFIDYIKNLPKEEYTLNELIELIAGPRFEKNLEKKDFIIKIVLEVFEFDLKDILKKSRKVEYVECRKALCYFLTKYTSLSQENIGNIIKRNHATIFYAKQWVSDNFGNVTQKEFYEKLKIVDDIINEKSNN
jgi:chromosomal replication initiation ATPase DnaA